MLKLIANRPKTRTCVASVFSGTTMMTSARTSASVRTGWRLSAVVHGVRAARAGLGASVATFAIASGCSEQAARAHQQHQRHQREDGDLRELRKEQAGQAIHHADEQATGNGAPVTAH